MNKENITTVFGTYSDLGQFADEIRQNVFIEEQGMPADEVFDKDNKNAVHLVVFDHNNTAFATARIITLDNDVYKIGLVAVIKSERKKHIGKYLMEEAIEYIKELGGKEIILSAQEYARNFYEKLGFVKCGDSIFNESGFVLIPMKLIIEKEVNLHNGDE
ncbi:MAG: GNAT family N-acetyltransferase [Clostridioides sp.]|jgi:predicted GNAT family N-acyltransferase|nr:GNAT family N-acetyltransferase [Clostridioides sp.]